uniref:Serine protease n=1 Tax=Riboviria sp. TaxID=2585031 RepID=A0A8K1U484_9VIRU|nr:MAG: hypothetical protein 1 [Riboviria sp.]
MYSTATDYVQRVVAGFADATPDPAPVTEFPPPLNCGNPNKWFWMYLALTLPMMLHWYYQAALMAVRAVRRATDGAIALFSLPASRPPIPLRSYSQLPQYGTPESYRAGSEPFPGQLPTCQAHVYVDNGNGPEINGSGWRHGNHFVTAYHVVQGAQNVYLARPDTQPIFLGNAPKYVQADDDIAVFDLSPRVVHHLGLSSAKIDSDIDGFVRTTGIGKTSTTTGRLQPTDHFGMLEYTGTTHPGYSGSPYMVGVNTVVAMHLSGGQRNVAVSADYVATWLERLENGDVVAPVISPEKKKRKRLDNDWYGTIDPGQTITARKSPGDPAHYEVRMGTKYYYIDADEMSELKRASDRNGANLSFQGKAPWRTDDDEKRNRKYECAQDDFLDLGSSTSDSAAVSLGRLIVQQSTLLSQQTSMLLEVQESMKSLPFRTSRHLSRRALSNEALSRVKK